MHCMLHSHPNGKQENLASEISNVYEHTWQQLTKQYFPSTRWTDAEEVKTLLWPDAEEVTTLLMRDGGEVDAIFLVLYKGTFGIAFDNYGKNSANWKMV